MKHLLSIPIHILLVVFVLMAAVPQMSEALQSAEDPLPENRVFGEARDSDISLPGEVEIRGVGTFPFEPEEVDTLRPDLFREGFFSLFDVLVHLSREGLIELEYEFDETMNTYHILSLNGQEGWWYNAYYDGGWPEASVFRMDHYPYKDKMFLEFRQRSEDYLASVYATYREEVQRTAENEGKLIVPEVIIQGRSATLLLEDVEVHAHNLRNDIFQEGVITAIDVILSLAAEGKLTYDLQWYDSIGTAGVVGSYWVNRINNDESHGRCGFVYEAGSEEFLFFRGNHNHIPSDTRIINSPQYVKYFWICI